MREYAAHRRELGLPGQTHTAVRKAILEGRLTGSVEKVGRRWYIDPGRADDEWKERSDETQQRPPAPAPEEPGPLFGGDADSLEATRGGETSSPSTNQLQRVVLLYRARLAKLEFEVRSGKLVDADAMKVRAYETSRAARRKLRSIPDRLSSILSAEKDPNRIRELLDAEIDAICEELSRMSQVS